MWMTPFSGPSQRSCESWTSSIHSGPRFASNSCIGRPTSRAATEVMAVVCTSLPRPMVNANPCPSCPSPASVVITT